MNLSRNWVFIVLAVAVLVSCNRNPVISEVGPYPITKSDIETKNRVTLLYYPNEKRDMGLQLLTKAYTLAAILKNNGRPITDAEIEEESNRIDNTTLAPEMLQKIKDIFKGDMAAYKRVYVLPILAERLIYFDFFLNSDSIHQTAFGAPREFLQAAMKSPAAFSTLAKKRKLKVSELNLSRSEGWSLVDSEIKKPKLPAPQPENIDPKVASKMKEMQTQISLPIVSEFEKLKAGAIYPKAIDMGEAWLVARKTKSAKPPGRMRVQGVYFPKASYEEWLAAETRKVSVIDKR